MAGQTVISVNKVKVEDLLKSGATHKFVIPEYQRPYSWTEEQVSTLFEDITEFALSTGGSERKGAMYFLGSIVSYINEKEESEIIDGQQRLTSLFLLLRAILYKLEHSEDSNSKEAQNFINRISACLWEAGELTGETDRSKPLISSKVINNEGNEIFFHILETGETNHKAKDNYSQNYRLFQSLLDKFCKQQSGVSKGVYDFIYALLSQVIVLPITADSQDTALTIFSTLNNRGLPLSHADIFKAKIYNQLSEEGKNIFIEHWKEIEQDAINLQLRDSITSLFTYYMPYLRAKEGDKDSTSPSVRTYYLDKKGERLYQSDLLENLTRILNIWKVIYANYDIKEGQWDNNTQIRQALEILISYPNDYIKYPMLVFYLAHHTEPDFEHTFLLFLHKLIYECLIRFVYYPSVNAIKNNVPKLNVNILATNHPSFETNFGAMPTPFTEEDFKQSIVRPHYRLLGMLLKIYAYKKQPILEGDIVKSLLPANWQVEHIFPQKWDSHYFAISENEQELIEHIGNKVPFEQKLNIQAGNGFFSAKKEKYKNSVIAAVRNLLIYDDWTPQCIKERDTEVVNEIWNTLKEWNEEYINSVATNEGMTPSALTKEQEELIAKLKATGYKL